MTLTQADIDTLNAAVTHFWKGCEQMKQVIAKRSIADDKVMASFLRQTAIIDNATYEIDIILRMNNASANRHR